MNESYCDDVVGRQIRMRGYRAVAGDLWAGADCRHGTVNHRDYWLYSFGKNEGLYYEEENNDVNDGMRMEKDGVNGG